MSAPQHRFPLIERDLINPESRVALAGDAFAGDAFRVEDIRPETIARLMQRGRIERAREVRRLGRVAGRLLASMFRGR